MILYRKIILNISAKVDEKLIVSRLKVSEFKKWLEQWIPNVNNSFALFISKKLGTKILGI